MRKQSEGPDLSPKEASKVTDETVLSATATRKAHASSATLRSTARLHFEKLVSTGGESPLRAVPVAERLRQIQLDAGWTDHPEPDVSIDSVSDHSPSRSQRKYPNQAPAKTQQAASFSRRLRKYVPSLDAAVRLVVFAVVAGSASLIVCVHLLFQSSEWCGNHVLEAGEACDSSMSGCDATCSIVPGFECAVSPRSGLRAFRCQPCPVDTFYPGSARDPLFNATVNASSGGGGKGGVHSWEQLATLLSLRARGGGGQGSGGAEGWVQLSKCLTCPAHSTTVRRMGQGVPAEIKAGVCVCVCLLCVWVCGCVGVWVCARARTYMNMNARARARARS